MCAHKEAVSVAEMAKMVGLSRSRFYQLVGSGFPYPVYDLATHRPFYSPDLQQVCMEVRRQNRGIDGKPVLFHRHKDEESRPKRSGRKTKPADSRYRDLLAGLKSLGMAGVSSAEVEVAVKELHGLDSALKDNGDVLRAVFLHLKRQDISPSTPKKNGDHHDEP